MLNLKVRYVSNWFQFAAIAILVLIETIAIGTWIIIDPIQIIFVESRHPFRVEQVIVVIGYFTSSDG